MKCHLLIFGLRDIEIGEWQNRRLNIYERMFQNLQLKGFTPIMSSYSGSTQT